MAATESSTRAMAALDDLYRRHVGDVYRYTYAVLGNHADAEDVTQTTFVNALRALERGETPREPSHWLLAIAHNLVRQRWRQAATRPTMVELVNDVPEEAPEDDVQLDELVRALQRIPASQREALVMRELEGRPYREIAELLGMTTSALETLLFRARRSLAEELENLVTCQSAESALSRQSDGRISRKERRRLDAHVAECPSCARFARTQARQRKAFKGLAMLPVPVGLALFKDAPIATAATVSTIGESATAGAGAGGAAGGGATAGGSVTVGGTVAGGSLIGGAVVKVAAIVAAATVVVGVGYQGVSALGDGSSAAPAPSGELGPAALAAPPTASGPATELSDAPVAGRPQPAAPVEVSDPVASERKGALPVHPGDVEDETPTDDGPPANGGSNDGVNGGTAGAGGSAGSAPEGGNAPEAPAAPGPAPNPADDDDEVAPAPAPADDGGPTASVPPTSEPIAQPKTKKPRPTKAAKPKPKVKPRPKTPKVKPPKAKGPPDETPKGKTKPTADGNPAAGPKKPKPSDPPAAAPPATDPANGSPPPAAGAPVEGDEIPTVPEDGKNGKGADERGNGADKH